MEPVELNALLGTVRFTRFFPFGFVVFKDNYGKCNSVCVLHVALCTRTLFLTMRNSLATYMLKLYCIISKL